LDDQINEWFKRSEDELYEIHFIKQNVVPASDGKFFVLISIFYSVKDSV